MKRKVFTTLISAAMLISAVGCSSGGQSNNSSTPGASGSTAPAATAAAKGDVKLRFSWWGGQSRHDYTLKLIEMYEQQHPNVKIDAEYSGFDDYWKKLAPQAAANQLPDIIQMDISYLSQYGGKDQLEDLNQFTKSGVIDTSAMAEAAVKTGELNGKLYGMPTGVNATGTIFDEDMLKKAGVNLDPTKWTWTDLGQIAQTMKGQGKIMDHMRYDVFFPYYLRTQGQHYFNNDGTALGYTDNKYFIDFWTQYKKWYDAGYMDTLDKVALSKGTPEENPVALGTGFMTMAWSNQFIPLQAAAKKPLAIGGLPGPNTKDGLYMKPSMLLSISKSSKQKRRSR
ncbi:ABC transporter substrate-binding protein [Paenibacillus hexagrammi]|uniref:ABC transporter substrate-binding protein n=1 Tax=Paenibacillus hexagrammi TaxID=2908839 RepID=UPI002882DA1A|nr:ABC transporter substrate-binding protein [Paenibacillus sp. YPD9-1]